MPVPEDLMLYGRTDMLVATGDLQPTSNLPVWNSATRHRRVTRTLTFHFTHGWAAGNWRASGSSWYGATFMLDLDGTLYQQQDMVVRTNHVGGTPDFGGQWSFVNKTSISLEIARFGAIQQTPSDYVIPAYNLRFQAVAAPPTECNYSNKGNHPAASQSFKLDKMPGGTVLQSVSDQHYYLKVAEFDDARNPTRATYPLDVLFTEEQYKTMVLWAKCMCEMHRIPKRFLTDPKTGKEQPWIDVEDLIEAGTPQQDENKERVRAFQGMIGHNNIQRDRMDPGASMDFYRIKRGVSDAWWYPVNLDDSRRAVDYLDQGRATEYLELKEYKDPAQLDAYFAACEGQVGGYYPIGLNRLWHGGMHFPTPSGSRPVYAMANGIIVAARITNGEVMTAQQCIELPYSRCFVLMRHDVHFRNRTGVAASEIDYGHASTVPVYSLYMHLQQLTLPTRFVPDYAAYPAWLNHYMIDNPDAREPRAGDIFYPNLRVCLSDVLGHTGQYVVGLDGTTPRYGTTVHIETFTTADISRFSNSPWADAANRVEDTTDDIVCELENLDRWLQGSGQPGIDVVDIPNAIQRMRQIAVRFRSEWTLSNPNQLSRELILGEPARRVPVTDVLTQAEFERSVKPLCFHTEMQGVAAASGVGPFLNQPIVWHVHPLELMRWMNGRVDAHERTIASQDKRGGEGGVTNITVDAGYVTGFVRPVPSAPPAAGYAEVTWSRNTYEVPIDALCDKTDLAAAVQTMTRFHLRLLDALDLINDRPHGLAVLLSYVSSEAHAASVHAARHTNGHAVDIRSGTGVTAADWFAFHRAVDFVVSYLKHRDGSSSIDFTLLQGGLSGGPAVQSTDNSRTWLTRFQAASSEMDPSLTIADPARPDLLTTLPQMRIHLFVP